MACSLDKGIGIIKEGVEWKKFSVLTGKGYKRFNDVNIKEKMSEFLETINKLPEKAEAFIKSEDGDINE